MRLLTIIILLALYELVQCQDDVTHIHFREATPIWEHYMVDTTLIPIPGQPYWNKYTTLSTGPIKRDGNNLYVLGRSLEPVLLNDYGFVLDKLDINTGYKFWSVLNTRYNGNENDLYMNIGISKDRNIDLFGVVNDSVYNVFAINKKIDQLTGTLTHKTISQDTVLKTFNSKNTFVPYILKDSFYLITYLRGSNQGTDQNPIYDYGANTLSFDGKLKLLSKNRFLFDFDSLGVFSIEQPTYINQLNGNTILSLAYRDRYDSWDNPGTQLMWLDVSNPKDVKMIKIKDYSDIIPGTHSSLFLQRFNTINNTIHISHHYPNFDIQTYACYILWMDSIGNIKTYIPVPHYKDNTYLLCNMIYANDDFAYLIASPSVNRNNSDTAFDIIRIDKGVDSIKYISSLSTQDGETFGNFNIQTLYDDGLFIIGGLASKSNEPEKKAFTVYCFKGSDLGIDFKPLSVNEKLADDTKMKLYPNPTIKNLYVEINELKENSNILVFDILGNIVKKSLIYNNITQLNFSDLNTGIYIVKLIDSSGHVRGVSKVMKF